MDVYLTKVCEGSILIQLGHHTDTQKHFDKKRTGKKSFFSLLLFSDFVLVRKYSDYQSEGRG